MNRLRRLVKSLLTSGVGATIITSILRARYLRQQRKRFETLTGLSIRSNRVTLSQQDEYSNAFLGGSYSSAFITTANEIARLLTVVPSWADHGWQDGYVPTLASNLYIPQNQHIKSIRGRMGNDVYRILTLDTSSNAVYFELCEY